MWSCKTSVPAWSPVVAQRLGPSADEAEWIERLTDRWWVVHTRARHEKKVAATLARADVVYYLPLIRVQHTYAKCKANFTIPLFPGYLFVCGEHDACDAAWRTHSVAGVLRVEDQKTLRKELSQVQRVVKQGESVELFPSLQEGRRCRITGGPLKGIEGVVVHRGRRCRMCISVTTLGQSAIVEVDGALLEVVD